MQNHCLHSVVAPVENERNKIEKNAGCGHARQHCRSPSDVCCCVSTAHTHTATSTSVVVH